MNGIAARRVRRTGHVVNCKGRTFRGSPGVSGPDRALLVPQWPVMRPYPIVGA